MGRIYTGWSIQKVSNVTGSYLPCGRQLVDSGRPGLDVKRGVVREEKQIRLEELDDPESFIAVRIKGGVRDPWSFQTHNRSAVSNPERPHGLMLISPWVSFRDMLHMGWG